MTKIHSDGVMMRPCRSRIASSAPAARKTLTEAGRQRPAAWRSSCLPSIEILAQYDRLTSPSAASSIRRIVADLVELGFVTAA